MPYTIRLSNPNDVPLLAEIWRRSVKATHDFLKPEDFEEIDQIVSYVYLPNNNVWVVTDENDIPWGFMGMAGNHIDTLFLDPSIRGQGLGKRLIQHAWKSVENPHQMALIVDVNEGNIQAVEFYRHMGFVQTGRSEHDADGRPYPVLYMRCEKQI